MYLLMGYLAAALFERFWRAAFGRAVRTKDAAVACQRLEQNFTSLALPKEDTRIDRHHFFLLKAALGTG